MKISVILCTFNRCQSLSMALDGLAAQAVPESIAWEVIVVDNNSTDQTRQVAERYCRSYPDRFRYLFEPQQGKSNALNRGVREAGGDVLAFIDDDVTVESTWLRNLTAPFERSGWAGVGGRIAPPLDFSPPVWLPVEGPYDLSGVLALFDKGREGAELTEAPFGTNMAFRREIFDRHGLFRPDLGPCPGSEIRGEDTEFGRRVLKSGERLWYEPSAIVHHTVPENRLRKEYFLRFMYDHGRASIRERGRRPSVRSILGILLTSFRSRLIQWLSTIDRQERFHRKCLVWTSFGQIVETTTRLVDRKRNYA